LRPIDVLEHVLTEVAKRDPGREVVGEQFGSGARRHDLPTVGDRSDPRATMKSDPVIALIANARLPGVKPHPHATGDTSGPRVSSERTLSRDRGKRGIARTTERYKEGVPLRVHLPAAVVRERGTEQTTMSP
jgi:hypothetical protein